MQLELCHTLHFTNFTFLQLCQEGPLFAPSSTTQVSWKVIGGRLLCSSSSLATVGLRFLFDLSTWLFIFLKHLEFVFNCRVPNTWEIKVTCSCEEVEEFYSKPSTRWKPLREVSPTSKRKKPLTELRFDYMYFRRIQPNTRVVVHCKGNQPFQIWGPTIMDIDQVNVQIIEGRSNPRTR